MKCTLTVVRESKSLRIIVPIDLQEEDFFPASSFSFFFFKKESASKKVNFDWMKICGTFGARHFMPPLHNSLTTAAHDIKSTCVSLLSRFCTHKPDKQFSVAY